MSSIGGLRTVIYKVADINAAKQWYAKAFKTQPYFDQPFYVGFSIDGYELGLQPEEMPVVEKAGNVVAYWATEEVDIAYNFLLGIGASANEAPEEVGEGIVVATVKDPWNNVIGLIYNPHFT